MALNAYLTLHGSKQGEVRGSVTQKGREGSILVFGFWHEIVCPRDPASGIPTGKRAHKPFVIQKEVDRSSPLLLSILTQNENVKSLELKMFAPDAMGIEKHRYTIRMTNANVSSIHVKMANNKNPKLMKLPEYEEVAFTYQHIEWTWMDGGISAADDWEAPRT